MPPLKRKSQGEPKNPIPPTDRLSSRQVTPFYGHALPPMKTAWFQPEEQVRDITNRLRESGVPAPIIGAYLSVAMGNYAIKFGHADIPGHLKGLGTSKFEVMSTPLKEMAGLRTLATNLIARARLQGPGGTIETNLPWEAIGLSRLLGERAGQTLPSQLSQQITRIRDNLLRVTGFPEEETQVGYAITPGNSGYPSLDWVGVKVPLPGAELVVVQSLQGHNLMPRPFPEPTEGLKVYILTEKELHFLNNAFLGSHPGEHPIPAIITPQGYTGLYPNYPGGLFARVALRSPASKRTGGQNFLPALLYLIAQSSLRLPQSQIANRMHYNEYRKMRRHSVNLRQTLADIRQIGLDTDSAARNALVDVNRRLHNLLHLIRVKSQEPYTEGVPPDEADPGSAWKTYALPLLAMETQSWLLASLLANEMGLPKQFQDTLGDLAFQELHRQSIEIFSFLYERATYDSATMFINYLENIPWLFMPDSKEHEAIRKLLGYKHVIKKYWTELRENPILPEPLQHIWNRPPLDYINLYVPELGRILREEPYFIFTPQLLLGIVQLLARKAPRTAQPTNRKRLAKRKALARRTR